MGAKTHVYWIVGAGMLSLAAEGWQHTAGETLANSVGVAPSLVFVIGSTGLGYIWSLLIEPGQKETKAKPKPPVAKPKRKPRH